MRVRPTLLAVASTTAAVIALGVVQLAPGTAPVARADGLVGYSSCDDLVDAYRTELARTVTSYGFGGDVFMATDDRAVAASEAAGGSSTPARDDGAVGSGATGTNLQEQGVDEPDLAKLSDGRLVVLTGNTLRVVSADAQPRQLGSLRLGDGTTYGGELLLLGDRALAMLPGYRQESRKDQEPNATDRTMIWNPGTPTTHLALVDLSDDNPRLLEEAVIDGQYVSARLVDGTVRLVTTTRPVVPVVYPMNPGSTAQQMARTANLARVNDLTVDDVLPTVERRDATGRLLERGSAVECGHTFHAQSGSGASTLLVTTMRPGDGLAATDRTAVTTDGDLVYAAEDRLYVATSRWGTVGPIEPLTGLARRDDQPETDEVSTEIHAFDTTSETTTRYIGTGTVPGYVLGRWALSRHDGDLRVATTRQPPWNSERAGDTHSMLVRLVEQGGRLVETGRVGGLGRTEHIRAVRYFGDIAAVVTFRQTDPLYLVDLSGDPKVLGELKVPGFSTYLHPIGDGLLLGLGQDATQDGQVTGMQVSVFDTSDLTQPALVDRLPLGQGWSPALDDSRAFSYDPERRQATFAYTAYEQSGTYQSHAVGIAVDEDGSLRLSGRLGLGPESWATRVFTDGDELYAVSETGVVAGDAATLERLGAITF